MGVCVLDLMNGRVADVGKTVVACVDEANIAACKAFWRAGFHVGDRRQLYVCPLQ